jgi:hypothetical protein
MSSSGSFNCPASSTMSNVSLSNHYLFPLFGEVRDLISALLSNPNSPVTNNQDPNRGFDFLTTLGGTATNVLSFLQPDRGIPKIFRFVHGDSVRLHADPCQSEGDVHNLLCAPRRVVHLKWTTAEAAENLSSNLASPPKTCLMLWRRASVCPGSSAS